MGEPLDAAGPTVGLSHAFCFSNSPSGWYYRSMVPSPDPVVGTKIRPEIAPGMLALRPGAWPRSQGIHPLPVGAGSRGRALPFLPRRSQQPVIGLWRGDGGPCRLLPAVSVETAKTTRRKALPMTQGCYNETRGRVGGLDRCSLWNLEASCGLQSGASLATVHQKGNLPLGCVPERTRRAIPRDRKAVRLSSSSSSSSARKNIGGGRSSFPASKPSMTGHTAGGGRPSSPWDWIAAPPPEKFPNYPKQRNLSSR